MLIMRNVRSKSTTHTVAFARFAGPVGAGFAIPVGAGVPRVAAPRLRLVPGRVALFVLVLSFMAAVLVPRLAAVAVSVRSEPAVHVIRSGETLWEVARQNASGQDPRQYVDRLLQVNRLASAQVFPGQELILP